MLGCWPENDKTRLYETVMSSLEEPGRDIGQESCPRRKPQLRDGDTDRAGSEDMYVEYLPFRMNQSLEHPISCRATMQI